jgi:hypothetical protein
MHDSRPPMNGEQAAQHDPIPNWGLCACQLFELIPVEGGRHQHSQPHERDNEVKPFAVNEGRNKLQAKAENLVDWLQVALLWVRLLRKSASDPSRHFTHQIGAIERALDEERNCATLCAASGYGSGPANFSRFDVNMIEYALQALRRDLPHNPEEEGGFAIPALVLLRENAPRANLSRCQHGVNEVRTGFREVSDNGCSRSPTDMIPCRKADPAALLDMPTGGFGRHQCKARRQDFDPVRIPLNQRRDGGAILSPMEADPEKDLRIVE